MALDDLWTLTVEEREAVRREARTLGVEFDPSETHEVLRERVEAVKAGDERALRVFTWERQKALTHEAAKLAIVNATSVDDARAAIESVMQKAEREHPELRKRLAEALAQAGIAVEQEIKRRAPWPQTSWDRSATFAGQPIPSGVFSGSTLASTAPSGTPIRSTSAPTYPVQSAEDLRAENRRIGEEIAKAPPEWAYPLAWRLAVMAVVEAYNNRDAVVPFDTRYWEQKVAPSLHAYHQARLDGLLPEPAMMKAVRGGRDELDVAIVEKLYDGIACQAYERGRPGPGGVR